MSTDDDEGIWSVDGKIWIPEDANKLILELQLQNIAAKEYIEHMLHR